MENNGKPLVSILVTAYNSSAFIGQTLRSCIDQQSGDYEIVVSDDRSTDDTWQKIEQFDLPLIRKFRQPVNIGEYANRNFLIEQAIGDFVIFIDGEDLLYPHALTQFSKYAKQYPQAALFIARDWDEKIIYPKAISPEEFAGMELMGPGVVGLNFTRLFFKRELLLQNGSFSGTNSRLGDLYIQYLLGFKYTSVLIPEGFSWWRRRSGQASEKLLKDQLLYRAEVDKFMPGMIDDMKILNEDQKKIVFTNYYGSIMRILFYKCIGLHFGSVLRYWRRNPVPYKYISSFFKRSVRNYMDPYTGENPMADN